MANGRPAGEIKLDNIIGGVLRAGVLIAAVVVAAGGIYYLHKYGDLRPEYKFFRGEPSDLRSLTGIFKDALALRSRGIIQMGILVLVATPVARVALSVVAFIFERDYIYVLVTTLVLVLLILSLAGYRI
ncbi:MAG: DUF1634 domain-containing protein [Nitrospirota bacterium]